MKIIVLVITSIIALNGLMMGCQRSDPSTAPTKTRAMLTTEDAVSKARAEFLNDCKNQMKEKKQEYWRLMLGNDFSAAYLLLSGCTLVIGVNDDKELYEMVAAAEQQNTLKIIFDSKAPAYKRTSAISLLEKNYPDIVKNNDKKIGKARVEIAKKAEIEQRESEGRLAIQHKREAAERKKEGVRIGMSQEEVRQSSWGRPNSINRTVASYGTHEQWVYGGGHNYLYFENGRLTSIQN